MKNNLFIYLSGLKCWGQFDNDNRCLILNRIAGPAMVGNRKYKSWWVEGKLICNTNQKEFERILKLKIFWEEGNC